ncbi:hypothetical protein X737_13270 [Mesorhizobium sp. L48C026A00]|nr:hypothetical protein X737_13270 [Mesorhizobium sp. L48C026A00]
MVATQDVNATEDREIGTPPVPEKLDHRDDIAIPMPGMAPKTATPTKHSMDSQNSQRWMR